MSFLGGLKEMWNSSGGKAVSTVADAAESTGSLVGGAAKNTVQALETAHQRAGEAGLNVVTAGGYGRDKEISAKQEEIFKRQEDLNARLRDQDEVGENRDAKALARGGDKSPGCEGVSDHADKTDAVLAEAGKDPSKTASYVVEQGDTLSGIAQEKGLDLDKLTELNPSLAADPNKLNVGQELSLGDDLVAAKDSVAEAAKSVGSSAPAPSGPEISV